MKAKTYPVSYLFTMITELLHEMGLPQYTVQDVITFGHDLDAGPRGSVWVEVFVKDAAGAKIGTERHERWITHDISYADWASPKPQRDYLNFVVR